MRDTRLSSSRTSINAHITMQSHSFYPQNIFVELKMIAISSEFDSFRNKSKNAGRFREKKIGNAGRKATCGISRTIAGSLTPRHCRPTLEIRQSQPRSYL